MQNSPYQEKLLELLELSTLTPGTYVPTDSVKSGEHWAVMVDDVPVYLAGPADCAESMAEAKNLAQTIEFKVALGAMNRDGDVTYGMVSGSEIDWQEGYSAVVRSESGQREESLDNDELVGINLLNEPALTVWMCVNTVMAQILDPDCPELDDGEELSNLARLSS